MRGATNFNNIWSEGDLVQEIVRRHQKILAFESKHANGPTSFAWRLIEKQQVRTAGLASAKCQYTLSQVAIYLTSSPKLGNSLSMAQPQVKVRAEPPRLSRV